MEDFKYQSKAHCGLIFILMLLLSVLNIKLAAQAHQHTSTNQSSIVQQNKDKIFQHRFGLMDFTGFNTEILYNKAGQHLDQWNYTGSEANPILNAGDWQQLYHQYDRSNVQEEAALSLHKMKEEIKDEKGPTHIGVLDFSCQRIGREALSEKWVTEENGRYKRVGHPMFPYWEYKEIFAVAPIHQKLKGLDQNFILRSSEIFGNMNRIPDEIQIDFSDDRGLNTYSIDSEIPISWFEAGNKQITIKLRFEDEWKQSHSIVEVNEINSYKGGGEDLAKPDVVWVAPNYHGDAKGTIGIYSGCNNGNEGFLYFKKVMLLVEGFDPRNERAFQTNLDEDKLHLNTYYVSNQQGLLDSMRNLGWTIVILNHGDGGGDISENAMLTTSVIQWINSTKVGNDPLIVAGASMGAMITRYALTWMEKEGIDHQARLWVSIDGPMEGANIPLCVQHSFGKILTLVDYVTGSLGEWAESNLDALNTMAAHQMLLYHHGATEASDHKAYESSLKTEFDDKLHELNEETNGYPEKCRKIAVANGSISGTPLEGDIGDPFVVLDINLASFGLVDFTLSPVGDFESTDIISMSAEALDFLAPLGLGENFGLLNIDNTAPIDLAPGGYGDFHALPESGLNYSNIGYQVLSGILEFFGLGSLPAISWDYMVEKPYHCFVPTTSALGIVGDDYLMNVSEFTSGMEDSYPPIDGWSDISPFDGIFASTENEPHVIDGITAEIANFVQTEGATDNIYITNKEITSDEEYWAKNTLSIGAAHPVIEPPQILDDVHLVQDSYLDLKAGDQINFFPGFCSVNNGNRLDARILETPKNCNYLNKIFDSNTNSAKNNALIKEDLPTLASGPAVLENPENKIVIYPNPVESELNISLAINNAGKYYIELQSLDAKVSERFDGYHYLHKGANSIRYKVDHLTSGLYLLSIKGDTFQENTKIIIN